MVGAMNQLTWWLILCFLILLLSSIVSPTTSVSYSDHCASIVPESTPTDPDNTFYSHLQTLATHYHGGDRILGENSSYSGFKYASFRPTQNIYKTKANGVYLLHANLLFRSSNLVYVPRRNSTSARQSYDSSNSAWHNPLRFILRGFWSEKTGKLCMVGSASWYSTEGKLVNLEAVLKLSNPLNLTLDTSLVTGRLESLSPTNDPSYFEPISLLAVSSSKNYSYRLVMEEIGRGFPGGIDVPKTQSLGWQPGRTCSSLWRLNLDLNYANESSSRNCTPLGQDIDYLPQIMYLRSIQCSEDEHKARFLVGFGKDGYAGYYRSPFDPNTTLVAEASWDENKNQMRVVGCRILYSSDALGNARVGDCSTRLSFGFRAFQTIRIRSTLVGQIWTNKAANESGYFKRIEFGSSVDRMVRASRLRYEYTEIERARKSCPTKKPAKRKGRRYPKGDSYDMKFDMSVMESTRKVVAWGNAVPVSVGNKSYEAYGSWYYSRSTNVIPEAGEKKSARGPVNISYTISIQAYASSYRIYSTNSSISGYEAPSTNSSFIPRYGVRQISAEGVYNDETGQLCMVGCRQLGPDLRKLTNVSMDCDILLNFQFAPLNAKSGNTIKGSIESTREKNDSLFFEKLTLSSNAYYTSTAKQAVTRIDLEIVLALISNTLKCVFVGLQLWYVKKNPNVLPSMSLIMLVILTLGQMIPLVLNFEALFIGNRNRQNALLWSGGGLEVNEVIIRVVTMVAFLLQFRLLQLSWFARLGEGNQKGSWVAEKKVLFVSLPFYIAGVLIALMMKSGKNNVGYGQVVAVSYQYPPSSSASNYQGSVAHVWGALISYAGLVLDAFLLPQILLNIIQISEAKVLSHSFYIGTTLIRLLPHAYDLFRGHFGGFYFYADPSADFYSTTWDVIISCGGALSAAIIYLQQRFGSRCFLPRRFRAAQMYEKVPVVASNE
ncbi:uncharacterized protein LOC127791956 [Diospyros lotus]|uniref:uncharacterized protein LOC127791735 n=1 Tax=Diospyros lotus TaxID=55363 RepID=UPI002255007E|nr:uncharacterized protein LOC127791735 [Diospyros lotus]XP_052178147.1 uncharacterized protein LOC127791956 [Diospyros lotus]